MATRPDFATTGSALTTRIPAPANGLPFEDETRSQLDPDGSQWPVLVTGAGGFVGGHIARHLAASGHFVRGLTRRNPKVEEGDPRIDWIVGDLSDPAVRRVALRRVRGVIHAAGWVSLGPDPLGTSRTVNVELTSHLLAEAAAAGVERFVYTSTLYTLAAGTANDPADEFTQWNLERVDSPYTRTKREAERLVLEASRPRFSTVALCPGMVLRRKPRRYARLRRRPGSSRLILGLTSRLPLRAEFRSSIAVRWQNGLHRRRAKFVFVSGGEGERYAVVGPYLSYGELAAIVASIAGRPRRLIRISDRLEPLVISAATGVGPFVRWWWPDVSSQLAAGGFLRLHVRGDRANACFGLEHPPAVESIARSL